MHPGGLFLIKLKFSFCCCGLGPKAARLTVVYLTSFFTADTRQCQICLLVLWEWYDKLIRGSQVIQLQQTNTWKTLRSILLKVVHLPVGMG